MWHSVIHPHPKPRHAGEHFHETREPFNRAEMLETIGRKAVANVTPHPMDEVFWSIKDNIVYISKLSCSFIKHSCMFFNELQLTSYQSI